MKDEKEEEKIEEDENEENEEEKIEEDEKEGIR